MEDEQDHFSSAYQIALASRAVRDLGPGEPFSSARAERAERVRRLTALYEAYGLAINLLTEALNLWDGNRRAVRLVASVRTEFARLAASQGDLDLAVSLLEAAGDEVKTAVLARDFPDTLVVILEERVPVVRILVPRPAAPPEPMFVAGDGVVYRGFNYDARMVRALPWLDGVRLKRRGSGFERLEGVELVSELLLQSRAEAPQLASTFRIISLAEYPRLVVQTETVKEIVFEGSVYRQQLARLDYILEYFARLAEPPSSIARIDLSVASQVAVRLSSVSSAELDGPRPVSSPSPTNSKLRNTQANRGL